MELLKFTDFLFLEDEKDEKESNNLEILPLYYRLLRIVAKEPVLSWNPSSLRCYLMGFYALSEKLSGPRRDSGKNDFNIYRGDDFAIFFTGLYGTQTYWGVQNGVFIVCKRLNGHIEREVYLKSDLLEKDEAQLGFVGIDVLNKFARVSSFEEEHKMNPSFDPIHLVKIDCENLCITDFTSYMKELEFKKKSIINKGINEKDMSNNWLHLLIDGIDNVPTNVFRIVFEEESLPYYKKKLVAIESILKDDGKFNKYQDKIYKGIKKAICSCKFSRLPLNFYLNGSSNPFQYLLPVDLEGVGKPDFCVCIDPAKGVGRIMTSFNMQEAFGNIRTFGKEALMAVEKWWR